MKIKQIGIFAVLCVGALGAYGQGPQSDTTIVADEVAAIVGNTTILLSDIERQAAFISAKRKERGTLSEQSAKEEAFETLLDQAVFCQQARADSLDKDLQSLDQYVEEEIQSMVHTAGSVTRLEQAHGKPIYQIRADLARQIQDMELARSMQTKVRRKTMIGYNDVVAFVKQTAVDSLPFIPLQYCFSKIVKIPPQTEERKYAIRERLLDFRRQVMAGEKMFSVLARFYSMDGSAPNGGEMGPQDIKSFVGPFAQAVEALTPGQVSEIVETEYGLHIIELISFDKRTRMAHVRHILLKPEFTIDEEAKVAKELDSLATEVRAGRLDFAEAAGRFSEDAESKMNGGRAFFVRGFWETGDINHATTRFREDQLAQTAPMDYRQIRNMKPGDVSECYETVDSKGSVVQQIIRLDQVIEAHTASLEQDYAVLRNIALSEKQVKEVDQWLDKTIDKLFIEIQPAFAHYQMERKAYDKKKK